MTNGDDRAEQASPTEPRDTIEMGNPGDVADPGDAVGQQDDDENEVPKPELVIGLVGPVGTDLHQLARSLEEKLGAFKYRSVMIRVSKLIENQCETDLKERILKAKGGDRIRLLMSAGDALRKSEKSGDALIPLIVGAIRAARSKIQLKDGTSPKLHANNVCYIVDSLKHPAEVKVLRELYGDGFVLISGFDSQEERKSNLKEMDAKALVSTETSAFEESAVDLITTDAKRPGQKIGQNVRETFPLGDFFIRVADGFETSLSRFLDAFFGNPYLTPRRGEYLMFEASANALRSADLSRQIGAVIADKHGEIVSSGCNEVPQAGGGAYWPDDDARFDNRDFKSGKDFNAVKKFDIVKEFLTFLYDNGIMTPKGTVEDVVELVQNGSAKEGFKDLRVSNLIEFGRVVHAEMSALMRAAQRGIAVGGGEIYSTTFPCHMCARHIISAGIRRVVYIEPYPKSMTAELFPETVSIDAAPAGDPSVAAVPACGTQIVRFEPFEGIAPSIFPSLFRAGKRKDAQGYTIEWLRGPAMPKMLRIANSDLRIEQTIAIQVDDLPKLRLQDVGGEMADVGRSGSNKPANTVG